MWRNYPQANLNKYGRYIIGYDGYGGYCKCYSSVGGSTCHCYGGGYDYYPWWHQPWSEYGWHHPWHHHWHGY